jgi:predicted enzyme related to lactoylglutathione lyase
MGNAGGMARFGLVIDCRDPEQLAEFWATALGYVRTGAAGNYVLLLSPGGDQPKLLLQRVPEAKTVKNRLHIDIDAPDIEAEAARLEAAGARRASGDAMCEHDCSWLLMADPEGNEFCICNAMAGEPAP